MQPQGTAPINAEFFTELTARINAIDTCSELQSVVDEAMASINAQLVGINAQIAALSPILSLLTAPGASLGGIVTWITSFITNVLTPYYKPYLTSLTQLTEIAAQYASMVTAIEAAASRLTSCSITIPPLG
jgi:hypothetical protein